MKRYAKQVLSAIYRIFQFFLSLAALGVSATGITLAGNWDRGNFALAVSALSCAYLICTLTLFKVFTAAAALACDIIGLILWVVSFALVTQVWVGANCSYDFSDYYSYYYIDFDWSKICTVYMVVIAFGAINIVSYLVSVCCIARLTSKRRTASKSLGVGVLTHAYDEPPNDFEAGAAAGLQDIRPTTQAPRQSGSATLAANDLSQPEEESKLH
ncbi:hypothetical protein JA9_005014 [Meyerozyma sp. JA9]|nr:hypothetical protein JA9_005014 [Meyerozyma sp. JA9]